MQVPAKAATVLASTLVMLTSLLAGGVTLASPAQGASVLTMVSLGDSVPSGARCACTPYPELYARRVATHTKRADRMLNYAVSGATSATVRRQLTSAGVRQAVRASTIAIMMTGANDFSRPFALVLRHRQRPVPTFGRAAARVQANVTATVRDLRSLRPGIQVVVENYWNVVKDGRVGRRTYGAWGMRKAVQATAYANLALRRAASATGATYVSTLREFKGPHGSADPTRLLAADGDHPNARGHAVIAAGLYAVKPNGR